MVCRGRSFGAAQKGKAFLLSSCPGPCASFSAGSRGWSTSQRVNPTKWTKTSGGAILALAAAPRRSQGLRQWRVAWRASFSRAHESYSGTGGGQLRGCTKRQGEWAAAYLVVGARLKQRFKRGHKVLGETWSVQVFVFPLRDGPQRAQVATSTKQRLRCLEAPAPRPALRRQGQASGGDNGKMAPCRGRLWQRRARREAGAHLFARIFYDGNDDVEAGKLVFGLRCFVDELFDGVHDILVVLRAAASKARGATC